jgi:hypothetical protein
MRSRGGKCKILNLKPQNAKDGYGVCESRVEIKMAHQSLQNRHIE